MQISRTITELVGASRKLNLCVQTAENNWKTPHQEGNSKKGNWMRQSICEHVQNVNRKAQTVKSWIESFRKKKNQQLEPTDFFLTPLVPVKEQGSSSSAVAEIVIFSSINWLYLRFLIWFTAVVGTHLWCGFGRCFYLWWKSCTRCLRFYAWPRYRRIPQSMNLQFLSRLVVCSLFFMYEEPSAPSNRNRLWTCRCSKVNCPSCGNK